MGIFADMLLAAGLRRHDQHVNHISNSLFGSLPEKGRCILCGGVDSGEFSNAKQIKLHAFSSRLQRAARKSLPYAVPLLRHSAARGAGRRRSAAARAVSRQGRAAGAGYLLPAF